MARISQCGNGCCEPPTAASSCEETPQTPAAPSCGGSCCDDEGEIDAAPPEGPSSCHASCCGEAQGEISSTVAMGECCASELEPTTPGTGELARARNTCCAADNGDDPGGPTPEGENQGCNASCCGSDSQDEFHEDNDSSTGCLKCDELSSKGEKPCCDG